MGLLPQRNRREEGRKKDTHVFLRGDLKRSYNGERCALSPWGSCCEENRWPQHTPKIGNSNRRLKLLNGFLGGNEKGSQGPMKIPEEG